MEPSVTFSEDSEPSITRSSVAAGAGGRRGSVADRRSQFIRASHVGIEELRERKERRKAAIKAVRDALEAESEKDKLCRPLRRFGCSLNVGLLYHKKAQGRRRLSMVSMPPSRRMVVLRDKDKWAKLVEPGGFFETELRLERGAAKQLIFQYFNRRGRGVRIAKQSDFQGWLEDMWHKQPPELHVYDPEAQPRAAEDRAELLSSIFNEYDQNGDGQLSMREVKEMILNLQLTERIGVSKEDMAAYISADFHKADADRNNLMSFSEFSHYFESLQDLLQDSLTRENKFEHTYAKFKERFVQAHSEKVPLGELVREQSGTLRLDKLGHAYGIEVRFWEECLSEENETAWARAQTLLESSVDYFEDETELLGELFSPVVWVEIEDEAELEDDFSLRFPHAFAQEHLSKEDVLVAYADFDSGVWHRVDDDAYRFLPGDDELGVPPSIVVRMVEGGIVAAFGRSDKKLKQRLRCVSYVPEKIIPLEMEQLNVYLVPALPDQEKLLDFLEVRQRGSMKRGGGSEVLSVRQSAMVEVSLHQRGGKTESHSLQWGGEMQAISYDLDPDVFAERDEAGPAAERQMQRDFHLEVAVTDLQARRLSVVNRHSASHGRSVSSVPCSLTVHEFPSPSPPRDVSVKSRTNTSLSLCWLHPSFWGGCALSHYEVQLRERTNKGVIKEWKTVGDASQGEGSFAPTAEVPLRIFAGELRVRAYSCASLTPSEWSEACVVLSEKEEKAAVSMQAFSRGHLSRSRRRFSISGATDEAGVAAVVQGEVADKRASQRRSVAMPQWSRCARAIGEFYLAAGVRGGVEGTLFDLTPLEVEELAKANAAAGGGGGGAWEEYPLLSLSVCGVWVLETLAHHTRNAPEWVAFMNDVAGLVNHAAAQKTPPGDAAVSGHHQAILYALMAVYETLRQSEANGYLTKQLEYRYDKKLRKLLKADWEDTLEALKNEVSTHVMELTLYLAQLNAQLSAAQPELPSRPSLKRLVSLEAAHPSLPTNAD